MAQADTLGRLKDRVAGHPGPVLSVYLGVSPALPENQGKGYITRLKADLKEEGVPEEVANRALDFFRLEPPRARTVVLFAAPDGLFEAYRLNVDLPERVRWGEPDVAPLMLALDEYERYGVVLLDRERFRLLVTYLGEIEAVEEAENPLDTAGWRELTISPASATPRGGSSRDDFEDRVEENTLRFYREMCETLRREMGRQGVGHLILAGPRERTSGFRSVLPGELRQKVVEEVPIPAGAPEGEVLERFSAARERAEASQEARVLNQARERGVRGVRETVEALQAGRVYRLLAAWDLGGRVRWSDAGGFVVFDGEGSGETRERPLMDVVVELAASRGARLNFVRREGSVYNALRGQYDGLVGLTRF